MEADGQVERRLAEEADRTAHYLSTFTHPPLQDLLVDHLLTPHLQSILDMPSSGLVTMVDSDRFQDLRRMYQLFLRVPENFGKDALRLALRMDIEERGKALNEGANAEPEAGPSIAPGQDGDPNMDLDGDADPKGKGKAKAAPPGNAATALSSALRWVQEVLELKDKFDRMLDQAFGGDKAVQTSINEVSLIPADRTDVRHFNLSSTVISEHPNSCLSSLMNTSRKEQRRYVTSASLILKLMRMVRKRMTRSKLRWRRRSSSSAFSTIRTSSSGTTRITWPGVYYMDDLLPTTPSEGWWRSSRWRCNYFLCYGS